MAAIICGVVLLIVVAAYVYLAKKPYFPQAFKIEETHKYGATVFMLPLVTWLIFIKFRNINYSFFNESPKIIFGILIFFVLTFFLRKKV